MAGVEVVTQSQGLEGLRREWQELMSDCATATPFQSYEWLSTWWRHFGRARPGRRLFVVTARDAGKLIGLAPWMISPWYGLPVKRLSFLGEGVTDYHDILAARGREEEACQAIYRFAAQAKCWQLGDLNQLREEGLLVKIPPQEATGVGFKDYPQEACPYLPYPPAATADQAWNSVLGSVGKKMRYNVGYYERVLRRTYEVQIGPVTCKEQVDEALDALFELHQRRWNQRWMPGVFNSRRAQDFHREIASQFLEQGWLRLHALSLDNQIQAALYCFANHERTCYYQAGFEPSLARLSLGTVLTAHAIRTSIEEGKKEFDFLRGNEPYKERWTKGKTRNNTRRLIARTATGLALAARTARMEHAIETRFKHWMHHRFGGKASTEDR